MSRLRRIIAPTAAMLAALAILLTLGTWQMLRKAEKEALIARVEARAFGSPASLPPRAEWARLDLGAIDFTRVRVTGRFMPWPEFHLYGIVPEARGRSAQPGGFVYAPLEIEGGGIVLVNRGAVPVQLKDLAARPASVAPDGLVTIDGLIRAPEQRGSFTNADDPLRNTFYTRDAAVFAVAGGLADAAPFTLEQTSANPSDLPVANLVRVVFPNRHFEYAMTWYGLALTLLGVWGVFVWRRGRGVEG
jgi:surfeit locus 1 family protein